MKATFSRHLLTTWKNCARACSISALLSFCFLAPSSARADVTNDVAAILAILNAVVDQESGLITIPTDSQLNYSLADILGRALYANYADGSVPNRKSSYVANTYVRLGEVLQFLPIVTNDLHTIDATTTDIDHVVDGILASFLQLSDEYFYGAHSYAWDVHLDDSSVGAISDSFDWLGGYLSNVVEHVGADMGGYLSNIDPYVSDIASAVDAEYEAGHMADEYEVSDEYIQDDLSASTNDLGQIEIEPGELPDTSSILDGVDAREFNMLPSLTGADPVIEVFRADRASNLPAFSIDFSVPSGIYNLISLFCTWLWRVLFFVAMWRLVEGEYNYWTTLGGGA